MSTTTSHKISVVYTLILVLSLSELALLQGQHESCSTHTCKPPYCRCPAHSIPGDLRPEQVPQMILLNFDDAVNWDNWHLYSRLFPPDGSRKNPNGCPISATWFVSHNFTDYCMVRKLHARGNEIGDHSVTHKLPRKFWTEATKNEIANEIITQRRNIAEKAHVPIDEIRGWRSPFLQPAGDDLFTVLSNNNFTYDATMTYSFPKNLYSPVLWPFTLDFGYTLICNIARCPKKPFKGFWVVPVVVVMDYREQKPCAYVDDCANMPRDKDDAYQMLWKNFLRNYRSNRAPLYLNLHSPWLTNDQYLEAMDQFIQKMVSMDDVYLVTNYQALQWQMDPTPLDQIKDFRPWKCPGFEPNIEDRKICKFTYKHTASPGGANASGVYSQHMGPNKNRNRAYGKWAQNKDKSNHDKDRDHDHKIEVDDSSDHDDHRDKSKHLAKHTDGHGDHHHDNEESSHEDPHTDHHDAHTDVHEDDDHVRHHHNHKTHKPWFLKGGSAVLLPHIAILSGILVVSIGLNQA